MAKTKSKAAKPSDITKKVHVRVVLDRSGSMNGTKQQTITGYNEYLNSLRADKEAEYIISLIQFDATGVTGGPELTISYENLPLEKVPALTAATYEPRGMTPLYDAIGECIRRAGDIKDAAVIIPIITDGAENASKEFTQESIKKLIAQKESEGWTFAFLAANIDSVAAAQSMGINLNSTSGYAQGNEQSLYSNLASSTMLRAASARTVGVQASSLMAFVSDEQRLQMMAPPTTITNVDPNLSISTLVNWGGQASGTIGGQPAVPATFQPAKPIATNLVSKPRAWAVSKP